MAFPMAPVVNPSIPYCGPVRLTDGLKIAIQGTVKHNDSFSINFTQSPMSGSDIQNAVLHFNPRFNERAIVRNSQEYGNWREEERSGGFPLQKGVPFEIVFHINHHHYKIHINGRHFANFNHRMPKETVNYLVITHGAQISFINFDSQPRPRHNPGGIFPPRPPPHNPFQPPGGFAPPPGPGGFTPYPGAGQQPPIYNPAVPFTSGIPGPLTNGRMIFISGTPHPNVSRFTINLLAGADIALHFDVRVNFGDTRNEVIRTHRQYGNYGPEERHQPYFPFQPNANFDMIILVEPSCFKIAVNNQHFTEFNHRIPVNNVSAVNVEGDVRLTQVRFQ